MKYDRHPELQNKWNKAFWARGYYIATVGNVTEDAIKKYIRNSQRNPERKTVKAPLFSGGRQYMLATPAFEASSNRALWSVFQTIT